MKKGFTLIELLAVIVILAIIALIATPIVLSIINDTKESATLRSVEYYLNAVDIILTSELNDRFVSDGTYGILENGNLCLEKYNLITKTCKDNDLNLDNNEVMVEVKGEKPDGGTITIINGEISDIALSINNKIVVKNENGKLTFGKFKINLVNYIKDLYDETTTFIQNDLEYSIDETHQLMNDRLGSGGIGKTNGNIRYYGANPNNYIDIGDRDDDGNIIFWRIIGVFKDIEVTDEEGNVTGKEDLVKIMRADLLTSGSINGFSWDKRYDGTAFASSNDWKVASLNTLLNDTYYNSGSTNYYNVNNASIKLNFSSTGLSSETHDKIEKVNWYLGLSPTNNSIASMYTHERLGTNKWSGKIALIYSSDYRYAADLNSSEVTANWMYDSTNHHWTLTGYATSSDWVFRVHSTGYIGHNYGSGFSLCIRPTLFLKSHINIIEEKETSEGLKYFVVE